MTLDVLDDAARPIPRRPLHEQVAERLREEILAGRLGAGERLPEQALCRQLRISRTPLREALKVLASEGLVELTPNQGARVSVVTRAEVVEVFTVLGALEALAGELACRAMSAAELASIQALHYQMVTHYEQRQLGEYRQVDERVHEAILEAAHNPTLARTYAGLSRRIRRRRYWAPKSEEAWRQSLADHEEVLAALVARDGEEAARLLRNHVDRTALIVTAQL